MANGRAKIATQSTSTSWLNNAIKSIGLSAKNVLQKEYAPNLYEAVSSGAKTSKSIVTTLRRNAAANNRVQNQLANNKYVKYAQTAYKNALYDLRTGNFNNEERANKEFESSLGFGELEDAFGDDFSFGDDGADVDVNIIGSPVSQDNSAMFALTDQVRKGTEATLKTNQANMNAMIAMNSASMMQIQTLSTQVIGELNSINQNISAMIEFNNTSMNKFIQSSLAFYERMGTRFDSEDSYGKTEKLTADQVMNNSKGGINFSTYKDYIKQNFKSITSEGTLGMLKGILDSDEMIQMAISNPLGFATESIIKYMMPKLVTNTIQSAEAAFSSFLPMLLHRVGEWGEEQANGMFGKVKQVIGKVFGLNISAKDRTDKFDVAATIEKGAVPFDGITRHAIVEVITKELREQTAYLRAIAARQGIHVDKALKSTDVFSYKTGTYLKPEEITSKILDEIRNSTVNGVMGGSFGKALRGAATTSADEDTQKKLNAMIDELAILLEKNRAGTVLRDEDAFTNQDSRFNKIMGQLSGASDLKKLLSEVLQDMVKNNPSSANDLARSVLSASMDRNKMIKYIQDNPLEYSLYAANLGGKDLDELILKRMRSSKTGPALKNGETIQSLLGNYQTAHPAGSNKWYSNLAGNFNNWLSTTTNDGGEAFFKKLIGDVKNGVQGVISGIMSGDSDKALKSIFESITTHIKGVWKSVDENFLGPIKDSLFGIKDAQGFRREGLLSGMVNAVKDTGFMIVHSITGKGYKSSSGKVINDKKEDEETVVGNIKKAVMTLANGIQDKSKEIYSKVKYRNLTEDEDENEEGITEDEKRARNYRNKLREAYRKDTKNQMFYDENGKIRDVFKQGGTHAIFKQEQGKERQSAIGFLVNSFKEGFIGWQEAFFGKELTDKEKENIVETMQTEVNKRLPSTITGSIAGTGIGVMAGGSLLGTITLGPIGGAAIGAAVGFASKSEEFQDWLFGKKDAKTKERMGGFISKNVQDYVKKNKGALAVGGTLGAIKGAMGFGLLGALPGIGTGIGILNSVVGGPVLGALMGIAGTIFTKSHMFKEFLFGDKETGQKGIIASFKSVINYIRDKDPDDELSIGGKLFGMNMIGAGGGALTAAMIGKLGILGASLTPGGVIGGALVGLGLAIRASKDNFKSWLFGEKDKNGKKTREGVLGQFRNMMIVNVVHPLRNVTLDILDDAKMKFQDVLDTVRWAVEPFGTALANVGKGLKNLVTGWFNKVADSFKENIVTPLGDLIFKPITKAVGAVTKALWMFASNIAMTPFRLVKDLLIIVSNPIVKGIEKGIKKISDLIQNKIIDPIKSRIKSFTSKLFGGIKTILNWTIKKPFDKITALATYAIDKKRGVGKDDKKFESANGIKGSVWKQMRERFKQNKVKRYNNKKASRERKIRTKNEQAIAKATGNQKIEDTEENRRIAEAAGFKINRDIEAVTTQEEADRAKIVGTVEEINTHEDRQTELMEELVNRVGNISDNLERQNQQENSNQGGGRRKRGKKKKKGQQNNTQSGTNNPEGDQSSEDSYIDDMQSNIAEAKRKKDEERVVWADGRDPSKMEDISSNSLEGPEKILHDIYAAGGAGKYIKNGVSKFFGGAKEGFKNSWLGTKVSGLFGKFRGKGFARGTTETPYGEDYDVGEAGRELMISTVGENGRERMSGGGRSIIPFIHGATALPVFIQGAQPGVFSSILTGLKSFFIDKPLSVLRGAKNAIKGHLATKQAVDSYVDSSDVMGDSQIMLEAQTLGGSDNPDKFGEGEGGGASLAGIAASVEASHSADGDSEASQEAEEDDKRNVLQRGLSFLKQKFAAKKGLSAEELKEQEAKRKERKDIAIIGKNTGEQVKSQNKFTDLWSSIFSKKGLITAGLILAAPLIINLISGVCKFFGSDFGQFIQHIIGAIGNTIGWAIQSLIKLFTNGGLGDGKNIGDTINETINRFADLNPFGEKDYYNDGAGTFGILNEDGRIDRYSAPMAKGLVKAGAKTTGTVVGAAKVGVSYFKAGKEFLKTGGISKATKDTLKSFSGKKLKTIGSETLTTFGKKTAANNAKKLFGIGSKGVTKEAVEGATKVAAKEAVEGAAEGGTKLATTALKEGNKGLLSKVIGYVKDFFSKVLGKAEGFVAKHSSKGISKGIFKNVGEKVTQWLTKNFGKVGGKITEFLATTAGLAATVVGWLVKEGAWVLLGALDGLTGARKLFHIDDEPDWKMTAIATLLGAFGGTTIGCIMDIINGAICAATGFDIYCELATLIYNCVSSQEDQLKLRESREKFENEYYAWAEDQMRTQYKTMKKYGLLKDPNMSEDDYVAAVKAGEEDAAYMGIQEYNVEKHKSVYDHAINGVATVATKVGFFSGFDKDYVKYDAEGNKYTNNHDGTWTVNGNDNEKISEDTVKRMDDEGKITKTEEQYQGFLQRFGDWLGKGIFNLGKGAGDAWNAAFKNKKGSAFVLPDGSYYDLDGNHYDAKHHLIKAKEKTLDELLKMKFIMQDGSYYDDQGNHYDSQGNLIAKKEKTLEELQKENADRMVNLEKDFEIQKSGFDQVISDFGDNWKSGFDSICNWVKDAFNNVKNAISNAINGWNKFWEDRGSDIYNGISWLNGSKKDEHGKSFGDYWWSGMKSIFHFAKGTENAPKDEVAMVGEEGPELMVMKGGEKVYANSKPLQVVLTGANKDVINSLSSTQTIITNDSQQDIGKSGTDNRELISAMTKQSNSYGELIKSYNAYSKEKVYENYFNTNSTIDKLYQRIDENGYLNVSGDDPNTDSGKVWFDPQGNYYKKSGDSYTYYSAIGNIIKENVPKEEFYDKLNASLLNLDDEPKKHKIKMVSETTTTIKDTVTSIWKTAGDAISNGWNSFKKWLGIGGSGTSIKVKSSGSGNGTVKHTINDFTTSDYGDKTIINKFYKNGGNDVILSGGSGTGGGMKYYSQSDPRWKDLAYGTDGATMSDTGCAPAAMSMVASSMSNKNIKPDEFAKLAEFTGMRDETGTNSNFINLASSMYGMNSHEVINPDENTLINSVSRGPTILLGVNGIGDNPYTSAGHYVVADNYSNGYISIKDPRGRSYNRRYKLSDVVRNTDTAWGFGGRGIQRLSKYSRYGGRGKQTDNHRQAWVKLIQDIKKLYNETFTEYSESCYKDITYKGKTISCRSDCSGFVNACLAFNGSLGNIKQASGQTDLENLKKIGFTQFTWDGKDFDKLKPGDIVHTPGHIQIYAGIIDGQPYKYSIGCNEDVQTPGPTKWNDYANYSDCYSADGLTALYPYDTKATNYSDGSKVVINASGEITTDDGDESVFSRITNWFSQFTSKAINGLITGKWDTNYAFSDDEIEIGDESNTNKDTGAIVSYDNPDTVKKAYGFFKRNGFTHPAAAGITANLYCESGLNPQNVGDDVNCGEEYISWLDGNPKNRSPWAGKGGITDEEFTKKVDSGEITKDEFTSAEWGTMNNNGAYGYGLMQWCTPPENKRGLYEYAKNDQHTSIGDMDMQLKYILKYAEKNDPGFTNRINAESTPEDAADYFESHLERCGNASSQAKRRTTARSFYDELKDYDDFNALVPKGAFYSDYLQNGGTPTTSGPFGDFTGTRDYIWENKYLDNPEYKEYKEKQKEKRAKYYREQLEKLDSAKPADMKKINQLFSDADKEGLSAKDITPKKPLHEATINSGKGGSGSGRRSDKALIKQIRPYSILNTPQGNSDVKYSKRGGRGEVSIYSPSITATFKPSITAKKYISSSSSTDVTTAINYIIGYLEAITNNTAGANDKLTALRNLSNSNQIYVGTTNNNINGKPTKSTTVVKSSNNGQINNSISRGMQIAQKIAKG
jgi:hypothetical protein